MSDHDWVLVGVDAAGHSDSALRYGAREARRLDARLRLLHVVPDSVTVAAAYERRLPLPAAEGRSFGIALLTKAAGRVSDVLPAERISSSLVTGNRIRCLTEAADAASLTVLGDGPRPVSDRLISGGVLSSVAALTTRPVVVVPTTWRPSQHRETVVAALRMHETSAALVRRALHIAVERRARLVLLHAWEAPVLVGDEGGDTSRSWASEVFSQIEALAIAAGREFPTVDVDVRLEHGQAAEVIVDASRSADLLLLARRPHGSPLGRLGSTGRTVVCQSRCPVEVLTPGVEHPDSPAPATAGSLRGEMP